MCETDSIEIRIGLYMKQQATRKRENVYVQHVSNVEDTVTYYLSSARDVLAWDLLTDVITGMIGLSSHKVVIVTKV